MADHSLAAVPANKAAGRRLRASRALLGMDQTALAAWLSEELGRPVDQQSVSCWERGTRTVPAIVLEPVEAAATHAGLYAAGTGKDPTQG